MPSAEHNNEAAARDQEVAALRPDSERRHLRATLPARLVLRSEERDAHARELKIVGESFLTAVVADGNVEFYADAAPVWLAASIASSRIVGVSTSHEFEDRHPGIFPMLRLTVSEEGIKPLDMDFEVFTFDGAELHQSKEIDADIAWWKAAVAGSAE
jgi:hypothetical protein